MHTHTTALATTALLLTTLTACNSTDTSSGTSKPAANKEADDKAATGNDTASLPDMTGKGLQSAQDNAQAAGFYSLTSHDALSRGRIQTLDRNWKVCSQTPQAGENPTDTEIDFATVKLEEDCPAKDQGEPQTAGSTMPDFKGKSVKAARQSLDSNTSLTVNDASGNDRLVLIESNWQICTQEPTAGTNIDGQPVTLTTMKFEETCP